MTFDKTEADADKYFEEMPWIMLPWDQIGDRQMDMFKLTGQKFIPAVTMIDPDFNVINPDCKNAIFFDEGTFPWAK